MNIEAALEELAGWGEDDWIGLWLIVSYVADDLGIEDPNQQLETTLVLVNALLARGFRAGDSPAQNGGVYFVWWPDQDPAAIAAFIRREWARNDEFPSWGDRPWFAAPRFCRLDA
jgi:hypothetical protein